ncbi:MAG: ESPR domain-containing protein, partial [Betaproteobacteria bacterium]|nr:ESPR domain-containing protein [Betaproteobacteria bacterium]
MNKHLYRTVFNKHRGLLMAVAENVSSHGKQPGTGALAGGGRRMAATLRPVCFSILLSLGMVGVAVAQVVADPHAPKSQQPV